MRYYQDATTEMGRHGAHRTYYSAARLMYIIKREEGDWTGSDALLTSSRPVVPGNRRQWNHRGNFIFARVFRAFAAVTVRQKP